MKQALITVAIFATLTMTLQAECSKAEVMKLIDKGFSKAEIASICDISTKSNSTHTAPKSKWITPTNKVCRALRGELYKGICAADWHSAKSICSVSGGRLPTKRELIQVIDECGGNTANTDSAHDENWEDPNYQACYKRRGFGKSYLYWSSTPYMNYSNLAWGVGFYNGDRFDIFKNDNHYVRCVRDGQ